MTETLRDKIARAICDESGYSWDGPSDECDGITEFDEIGSEKPSRQTFRNYASAALTALAVAGPTDEMVEAGARALAKPFWEVRWKGAWDFEDFWANRRTVFENDARACFTAMLAGRGRGSWTST